MRTIPALLPLMFVFAGLPASVAQTTVPSAAAADAGSQAAQPKAAVGKKKIKEAPPVEWPVTPEKLISAQVRSGVLTVDGLVVSLHLNYDIQNAPYLYLYVPNSGTAVVSLVKIPDAVFEKDAIHGHTLTVSAGGHTFQLTGSADLLTSDKGHHAVYVHLDREAATLNSGPMLGYGAANHMPYQWPVSTPDSKVVASDAATIGKLEKTVVQAALPPAVGKVEEAEIGTAAPPASAPAAVQAQIETNLHAVSAPTVVNAGIVKAPVAVVAPAQVVAAKIAEGPASVATLEVKKVSLGSVARTGGGPASGERLHHEALTAKRRGHGALSLLDKGQPNRSLCRP